MAEGYAGDIDPQQAWKLLAEDPNAVLVDVRTDAEWKYVGIPDLSDLGKDVVTVQWKVFPEMDLNPIFRQELEAEGVTPDQTLALLCRSGQRSAAAARALTDAGYRCCYNVAEGFEGDKDAHGHRGTKNGWQVRGLPWIQE